ncbi:MAG: hypothetical protein AN485_15030, partial [Anabaena sp. MDT14b]|jgi:hypothetical protein
MNENFNHAEIPTPKSAVIINGKPSCNRKSSGNTATPDITITKYAKSPICNLSKRMFEKWYSVIFITLLPPFPLVKGGNNKNPVPSPLQGEG